jgi:hypothetical protein
MSFIGDVLPASLAATSAASAGAASAGAAAAGSGTALSAGALAGAGGLAALEAAGVAAATMPVASSAAAASGLGLTGYASIAAALASAGLGIAGAQQQAATMRLQAGQQRTQAAQTDFSAQQEVLKGREQANQVRGTLLRTLASQNARYAGAGLTLEGTPETVAEDTINQAERELALLGANSTIRSEGIRTQANLLRESADWTEGGAPLTELTGSAGSVINLFDRVDRIGARRAGTVMR